MKKITELDELDSGINVIKFSASWCGPCKKIAPLIDDLERELPKVKFHSVDVGELNGIAPYLGVFSVPTIMILEGDKPIDSIVGTVDKITIRNRITKHL